MKDRISNYVWEGSTVTLDGAVRGHLCGRSHFALDFDCPHMDELMLFLQTSTVTKSVQAYDEGRVSCQLTADDVTFDWKIPRGLRGPSATVARVPSRYVFRQYLDDRPTEARRMIAMYGKITEGSVVTYGWEGTDLGVVISGPTRLEILWETVDSDVLNANGTMEGHGSTRARLAGRMTGEEFVSYQLAWHREASAPNFSIDSTLNEEPRIPIDMEKVRAFHEQGYDRLAFDFVDRIISRWAILTQAERSQILHKARAGLVGRAEES
jgi:hypothetical protein